MRRISNHCELAQALARLGFIDVELEKMPMEDQIRLFYNAEMVVGPHGAGLANLLFAKSTRVLELFGTHYVVPHYLMLSAALDHEYSYICGINISKNKDFEVDVEQVFNQVQMMLQQDVEVARKALPTEPF